MKWKTSDLISSALIVGATAWIEGCEIPSVELLNLPDSPFGRMVANAYCNQGEIGWNLLFRGFWASAWRCAHEYSLNCSPAREKFDSGERWAGKAQTWFIDLFDVLWSLRNANEHGDNIEEQRRISLTKCERAIRRLYLTGEGLPDCERHPFRDELEVLLQKSVPDQELWIKMTEVFLPKALSRIRKRKVTNQSAITDFFARFQD